MSRRNGRQAGPGGVGTLVLPIIQAGEQAACQRSLVVGKRPPGGVTPHPAVVVAWNKYVVTFCQLIYREHTFHHVTALVLALFIVLDVIERVQPVVVAVGPLHVVASGQVDTGRRGRVSHDRGTQAPTDGEHWT